MTPSKFQIWLLAARPKTLPASAAAIIVGAAVAFSEGVFQPGPALATLLGGLLLQIGANLANDVFDFKRGADTPDRLGPTRVTQAGLLTPKQVLTGLGVVFGLAALAGFYLMTVSGWPVLAIGLLSILCAIIYTGGPFPLAYHGLGDLFVFIFFGLAAVCGTYYVQVGRVSVLAVWAAIPMGLLTTNILVVNNLRDIDTDRTAGKKTLAVRLGRRGTQVEYLLWLTAAYLIPPLMALVGIASPWVILTWLSLPLAAFQYWHILHDQGRALNAVLAGTARLGLIYGVLFSVGLAAGRFL